MGVLSHNNKAGKRKYFHRYTEDAVDLCDVLSAYSSQGKATLHEICRVLGLPGKPDGVDGADVAQYHRDGRIQDIADYCESDVVNTYRVWLRYELFRGKLTEGEFQPLVQMIVAYVTFEGMFLVFGILCLVLITLPVDSSRGLVQPNGLAIVDCHRPQALEFGSDGQND
jgi:Predicted 3'-5' exonuclease related to the exonuclease domain of PolB